MANKTRTPKMSDFLKVQQQERAILSSKANQLLDLYKIDESGKIIEEFIKETFNSLFGSRFRATSGYIVYAENIEADFKFSPHIDVIIVDTLVPNIIFPYKEFRGKAEFVPQEAVVGIFEVKKTLNPTVIKKSFNHIYKIKRAVKLSKNNHEHYVPGGAQLRGLSSGIYSNPIFGIIGLNNEWEEVQNDNGLIALDKPYIIPANKLVDLIFTFDGFLQAIAEKGKTQPYIGPIDNPEAYIYRHNGKRESNLNIALGYITNYLQATTGKTINAYRYYGNRNFQK